MVPDVHEREIRLLLIAPLAAAVLWIGAPLAAAEEERTLARVVYEFAVTGYCGLQDAAVEAGYHAEVAALTARHGFDAEAARRQRLREIGRASWRERGCPYVWLSVVDVSIKKKNL